tara:strand:+ start:488 stop:1594 length:1107 start_codon:yes stop_codon:yes gene_type:complete
MRKIVSLISGIVLILLAYYISNEIASSKKTSKVIVNELSKAVYVEKVKNISNPISIKANGKLTSSNRIEIYSEVQGIFKLGEKKFKPGQSYTKGETMIEIDGDEFFASVKATKSELHNLITSVLPDLKLDYKNNFEVWEDYVKKFDINQPITNLPKPLTEKEKFFITGRGIYSLYYKVKNLEERILKYKIKAPFDGSLINTSITQGTLVKFGQKLGEYIDPSIFELEVSVPSQYSNFLKIGKKINYNSVFNKNHTGEIIRINNSIDKSTQTISVFVEFKSIDLKEGMYCEVDIPMKSEDNSYSISRSLLIDNDKIFYVKDDLTLDLITVQKIFFDKKNVIVKGIPDGINILSKQISGAYPGMQVKITN